MRLVPSIVMISMAVSVLPFAQAEAKKLTVLAIFTKADGSLSQAGLLLDSAGNVYGTTSAGGSNNNGTVFELTPPGHGQTGWTDIVLANFNGSNGATPWAGLIADKAGNLYGTTSSGGASGKGTVFELTPPAKGQTAWTETILHSFNKTDGRAPAGRLLFDAAGNLFGTTANGGAADDGVAFELMPPAAGKTAWTEKVLFVFTGGNGRVPLTDLIADKAGNLYGTTEAGGASDLGTVFALTPPDAGQTAWTEAVLVSFNRSNGQFPSGGLIADETGNLYGTTLYGGANSTGTAFEVSPPAAGQTAWTETVLYSFTTGVAIPNGDLVADKAGNLYGTASSGGQGKVGGSVFKLAPPAAGQTAWTESTLATMTKASGTEPRAGLAADKAGDLFGTTSAGFYRPNLYGGVFEVKK